MLLNLRLAPPRDPCREPRGARLRTLVRRTRLGILSGCGRTPRGLACTVPKARPLMNCVLNCAAGAAVLNLGLFQL
jgi:hypothetical protein